MGLNLRSFCRFMLWCEMFVLCLPTCRDIFIQYAKYQGCLAYLYWAHIALILGSSLLTATMYTAMLKNYRIDIIVLWCIFKMLYVVSHSLLFLMTYYLYPKEFPINFYIVGVRMSIHVIEIAAMGSFLFDLINADIVYNPIEND